MNKPRVSKTNPVKKRLLSFLSNASGNRESDEETVDLYVETYEFYQRMRAEVAKGSLLMEYTNKIGATNLVKNPLAIEITKTVQTLNNLLKSMGLTPAQRKDVAPADESDEFDEF